MFQSLVSAFLKINKNNQDIVFALGIIFVICILFLPIPSFLIDIGLAFSIALSVLILMVSLWVERPLEFSSFPTVLLLSTIIRLALNIATTRAILSHGNEGYDAVSRVVSGFSFLVMSGDFVIGLVVFMILITINFIVITKGATRIAEVGARFTLDAIPGKQMSIDADLSSGLIDESVAQQRRKELEKESSFFGAMDGASKFVRGDAIAALIITGINILGGILIGYFRHDMPISQAADVFVRLSVGDGLVSQVPALIISLAAGLLVSRTTLSGSTNKAVVDQLSGYPRALIVSAILMGVMAFIPGLPAMPFLILGSLFVLGSWYIPYRIEMNKSSQISKKKERKTQEEDKDSIKSALRVSGIELVFGSMLSTFFLSSQQELLFRVGKMRKKFAQQYGFIIPDIKVTNDISLPEKSYQIRIHGTTVASSNLRIGEILVIVGSGEKPSFPGEEIREPAFNIPAISYLETFSEDIRREGFQPIDNTSVMLTHLSEVIRNNLSQLLSYKDVRMLIDQLDPEYKKLAEEISSSHISYSGIQAVLKALLSERVSIRNLHLILEIIAELMPHVRKTEQIVEHVRIRIAQQLCGDFLDDGVLRILRLGSHWDMVFHQALKRDSKGDVMDFNIDPRSIEEFSDQAKVVIREYIDRGLPFVIVTSPESRTYIRMILERMFPSLPVLSHMEIAKGIEIKILGSIS
ncbi:Flagellar biosynthesis protein FlhA [Liberibacter crescens BT-1]|uniref:Flagellar biosynthesis protein FlhA n=1 Tax=Liberibacter crescens (strain BT-1) TaxID=1215343 RepID=L0EX30_LIBCB|nr:flagellar biosynthesis protein FlhA [Liberibacter crescens]AGA64931.1 Flagellar biosynthesis protein FlhA [Liberibacter crescens BT-1]AMC12954.1 flagellar biosynthesis protein FlhA [Liberibacter crescens]